MRCIRKLANNCIFDYLFSTKPKWKRDLKTILIIEVKEKPILLQMEWLFENEARQNVIQSF